MNLQLHLLIRITIVASLCLLLTAGYSLYHSHQMAIQSTSTLQALLLKQLTSQVLRINTGLFIANQFPDFELWKQSSHQTGVCLDFVFEDKTRERHLCNGATLTSKPWTSGFESFYRWLFNPAQEQQQPIIVNGKTYGWLTISPNADMEIEKAWFKIIDLMSLSSITALSIGLLVFFNIRQALNPAGTIVKGLATLEQGNLNYRFTHFQLLEWQTIATAINQLANSQQQLLAERQKLIGKLIQVQETERRHLARELHDEFGQCLVAINALAASIQYTAAQRLPELVDEAERIKEINSHILTNLGDLLARLRPTEFDEFGLAFSLNSLVNHWQRLSAGKTHYLLKIEGDCLNLTEPIAFCIFRLTQE